MSTKAKRIIILISALIITTVYGIFYVMSFSKAVQLKKECDVLTNGEVYTNTYAGRSTDFKEVFGASYIVDNMTYHAKGRDIISHHPGDIVTIHYKQSDPSVAYAGESPKRMSDLGAILIFLAGGLTIFGAIKQLIKEK